MRIATIFVLDSKSTGIVEFPVEWIRDDAVYFMMHRFQSLRPYTPPKDVLDIFLREFDAAYEVRRTISAYHASTYYYAAFTHLDPGRGHPSCQGRG